MQNLSWILQALNHDHEGLLPGPLNTLKGLFYGKDHVSTRLNITLRQCERDLRSKWGTLCSRSRFCDIVHSVASKELEVGLLHQLQIMCLRLLWHDNSYDDKTSGTLDMYLPRQLQRC